jgi:hypothetical protein
VPLPDGCEMTGSHLVFWELATEPQLADVDAHYERCCFVACTNALRPLGPVEIIPQPLPELAPGTAMLWGDRTLTAEAADAYRAQGFVLCEFRLPVQPMGAAVPPNVATDRPASTY